MEQPEIDRVEFSVLGPDTIVDRAEAEITEPNLYAKGIPNHGAVNDLRLGTANRTLQCSTCKNSSEVCAGHTGFIDLSMCPVVHWLYKDDVLKVLKCVCRWCQELIVDPNESGIPRFTHKQNSKRLSAIAMYSKTKKVCRICGGKQPKWEKEKSGLLIRTRWDSVQFDDPEEQKIAEIPMTTTTVYDILRFIPQYARDFLKIQHPENMIITKLLVPPPLMRPSAQLSDFSRTKGHDDLTNVLVSIVKCARAINKSIADGKGILAEHHEGLILKLAHYFDKDGGNATQSMSLGGTGVARASRTQLSRRGGAIKSLSNRLAGKGGRIRGDIVGKRVDHCARSVIVGNPTLPIWQLGVPELVAKSQTIKENVTPFNIEMLRECVRRGNGVLNGAHSCQRPDGSMIHLGMTKERSIIANSIGPGWSVFRHLRNGDWVLFNRQ